MYVSEKYRFIYMPPQKTGSTSISLFLENNYDAYLFRDHKLCKSKEGDENEYSDGYFKHWLHLPEKFKDFYVFATIRNPYRRFVSLYVERLIWNKSIWKYLSTPKESSICGFYNYVNKNTFQQDSFFNILHMNLKQNYCDLNPPNGCVPFKIHKFIKLEKIEKINDLPFINKQAIVSKQRVSNSNHKYKLTQQIAKKIEQYVSIDFDVFKYSRIVPQDLWLKQLI